MKKKLIYALAGCSLLLTACNTGNGENEQTMTYPTCNFVIPKDGTTPTMSYGSYTFKSKMSASLWDMSVSTTSLSINNTARTFVTQTYPVVNVGGYKQIIKNVSSDPASGGYEISNGTFMLSAYDNLPKDFLPNKVFTPTQKDEKGKISYIPGTVFYPNMTGYISPLVVAQYDFGSEYKVKTFFCDAFYAGKTNTSYSLPNGMSGMAESEKMVYRVIMDLDKKRAGIVIYNAKFSDSDKEPEKAAIYIPGLDITFQGESYEISGKDIIPLIPEGNLPALPDPDKFTPYPTFKFNEFKMVMTNSWLTSTRMEFSVADTYKGYFSGSYVKIPENM